MLIERDRQMVLREFEQLLNLMFADPTADAWRQPHFQMALRSFLLHADRHITRRELALHVAESWGSRRGASANNAVTAFSDSLENA